MDGREEALTAILNTLGPDDAADAGVTRVLPHVYDELRSLADGLLRGERRDHTLQPTALVHEAYMRLAGSQGREWKDRTHFFRLAAKTMRHILVDHARAKSAIKRGGGTQRIAWNEPADLIGGPYEEILEIDEALAQLFALSPKKAQVVELRYYGGCTLEETADIMGISTASVERDWRFARAWLKAKLGDNEP